jgi:pimeloyl-ACP methyl ester carboxylesterase
MTKSPLATGLKIIGLPLVSLFVSACASAGEPGESEEPTGTAREELSSEPTCERLTFPVALAEGQPASYHVVGWLCGRGPIQHRTIQVLLHGATYGHVYWDFPYRPTRYSYVRALTAAGYATLALDRIGIGESDHPGPFDVTIQSNAHVVHQVIQALRSGTLTAGSLGRVTGSRVMLVGHSLGSVVSIREAATYHDVDGVLLTGLLHNQGPGLNEIAANLVPTSLDPVLAPRNLPPGYLTTLAGKRGEPFFYYSPTTDPAVVAKDEATKETATPGEFSDFWASVAMSSQIDVPVLSVVGDKDRCFCPNEACAAEGLLDAEQQYYSPAASLKTASIPLAAHDINLHQQALLWYGLAAAWSTAYVGVDSRLPPLAH